MARRVAMELPNEDKTEEDLDEGMVGELMLAMPGTRDAANNWPSGEISWCLRGRSGFRACMWTWEGE